MCLTNYNKNASFKFPFAHEKELKGQIPRGISGQWNFGWFLFFSLRFF